MKKHKALWQNHSASFRPAIVLGCLFGVEGFEWTLCCRSADGTVVKPVSCEATVGSVVCL